MRASAVHQHTVQTVLVSLAAVCVRGQVLAIAHVQVQLLIELVPVIDLGGVTATRLEPHGSLQDDSVPAQLVMQYINCDSGQRLPGSQLLA